MIDVTGMVMYYMEEGTSKTWNPPLGSIHYVDALLNFLIEKGVYDEIRLVKSLSISKSVLIRMSDAHPS